MSRPGPEGKTKSKVQVVGQSVRPAAGDWSAPVLEGWDAFWNSPAAEVVGVKDHAALRRMFELRDRIERWWDVAASEGEVQTGSTGQPVLHPLLKQADTLLGEVRMLEDRFGLSPTSGLKVGLQVQRARRGLENFSDLLDAS